jgi:hypothetical protein
MAHNSYLTTLRQYVRTGAVRIKQKSAATQQRSCAPTGIRTPVLALKGLRPGPLDDGGNAEGIVSLPVIKVKFLARS